MASRRESDFLRLEKQLQEAERARQEAERARQEADKARDDANLRAAEERQAREEADLRADRERMRNQNATFSEYLQACHEHLHKPLGIETDKSLTTAGGSTNPQKKFYPESLRPWEDFPRIQEDIFRILHSLFHPSEQSSPRLFDPILSIEASGRNHCHIRLANEWSLRTYEHVALEMPVLQILDRLCKTRKADEEFGVEFGQGVIFENTPHSLNDTEPEVRNRLERLHGRPPRTPPSRSRSDSSSNAEINPDRTRADQYCVYKNTENKNELLFVVEYKPPHKLSAGVLQRGFREMNLKKEVIDRTTIPHYISTIQETFEKELSRNGERARKKAEKERDAAIETRLKYNADKLIAAVATQTFHYMIENGLEYSYITTGEAFVFLRILAEDPKTLYYHVTMPVDEIEDGLNIMKQCTAVAQVAILSIMAFQSDRRDHEWRTEAKQQLNEYPTANYEVLLEETPKNEREQGSKKKSSPAYYGRKGSAQSNFTTRSGGYPRDPPGAGGDIAGPSGNPSGAVGRGGSAGGQQRKGGNSGGKNNVSSGSGRGTQRQYCSQKCLIGLTRRLSLDRNCPNAKIHPTRNENHAIDIEEFMDLIQQQLARHVDHDCEPLGLRGARGALFKITLTSHGYVFVGKGTVRAFVSDLLHEGHIYERLEPLQGSAVPVCLGNIDLVEKYYLTLGVRIQHMLLMSWAGTAIQDISALQAQVQRTVNEVRGKGVDQNDVRSANLLWNDELQRLIMIDFERASIITDRPTMGNISPNKRRNPAESLVHKVMRVE